VADDLVISLFYLSVCLFCSVLSAWSEYGFATRGTLERVQTGQD
jgi:hypothetical protein